MKRLLLLPLLASALVLSGCGIFLSSKEKAMQKDPNYQSGYSDGCAAANAQNTDYRNGGGDRDEALFNTSKPYRSGWHSGFSACRSGYTSQPGAQQSPLPSGGPIH
jgi:hypothetical protein